MNSPRMVSWEVPALLSDGGPSADPRAKSRRRRHQKFLAHSGQKPPVAKPPAEPAPKADSGKAPASRPSGS
jgi:hypothetical protein